MAKNSIARNSTIYLAVSFLQKALSFLLLPLYTRFLSPSAYGLVNVVNTMVSILSVLFNLSLHGGASRFYYKYKDQPERVKKIWGTTLIAELINTLILSIVIVLFHHELMDPFTENIAFYPYILLGIFTAFFSPLFLLFQARLQAMQNGKAVGLNNLLFFIINATLTIVFLVFFRWGALGILGATAITNFIFFVYSFTKMLPFVSLHIDLHVLADILKYSLPLIPYNLASLVAVLFDRLYINATKGVSQVGLYSVGFQFANIMNILTAGVAQAFSPWFFERLEEGPNGKEVIRRNGIFAFSLFSLLGVLLTYVSPVLLRIMVGENYAGSSSVVPCLAFGYSVYGGYQILCNGLFSSKTILLPIITFIGAGFNVVLNMVMVPKFGMMGSAIASMAYNVLVTAIVAFLAERFESVGYRFLDITLPYLLALPCCMLPYFMGDISPALRIGIETIVVLFACGLFYYKNRELIKAMSINEKLAAIFNRK